MRVGVRLLLETRSFSSFGLRGHETFFLRGDGDNPVTTHDGADACQVRMMVGVEEGGDFEEILRAHDTRSLETEDTGGGVGEIGEEVGRTARYEQSVAATDLCG